MRNTERACANDAGLPDASQHVVRDMILLALDATETHPVSDANRLEARAALAEALDVIEGGTNDGGKR